MGRGCVWNDRWRVELRLLRAPINNRLVLLLLEGLDVAPGRCVVGTRTAAERPATTAYLVPRQFKGSLLGHVDVQSAPIPTRTRRVVIFVLAAAKPGLAPRQLAFSEFLSMGGVLHIAGSCRLTAAELSDVVVAHCQPLAVLPANFEALACDGQVAIGFLFRAGTAGHFHFRIHHLISLLV